MRTIALLLAASVSAQDGLVYTDFSSIRAEPVASMSGLAGRIAQAAWDAPDNLKSSKEGGRTVYRLYGRVINDASTEYGKLACARVASIILNKAGAGTGVTDGVGSLESRVRGWKKITSLTALEPGDVIIWTRRFADETCSGGGDCHVGIYWGSGLSYDNWGMLGYPAKYPVSPRLAYSFSRAYRAR